MDKNQQKWPLFNCIFNFLFSTWFTAVYKIKLFLKLDISQDIIIMQNIFSFKIKSLYILYLKWLQNLCNMEYKYY